MRWCGTMLALKKALPALSVYSARVLCSSYLPGWRPGVDYRTVYSAHKDMGGGVTIDLIHEWDYLVELFGKPEKMYNFKEVEKKWQKYWDDHKSFKAITGEKDKTPYYILLSLIHI